MRSRRCSAGKRSNRRCVRWRVGEVHLRERPAGRALVDVERARPAAGSPARPGSRCSPCRRPPRACRPARRRGASAPCGRPGRRSCRARGASGTFGTDSWPQAVISTSASCVPALVCSTHLPRCSSQRALRHLGVRADLLEHPVAARDVLEVGLDLGLRRVAARPVRRSVRRRTRTGARGRRTPRRDRCCDATRRRRARRARTRSRRR